MDKLTDREELAIQVLVSHPPTQDNWLAPIHAVDRAIGTVTEDSKTIVRDLVRRGYIVPRTKAVKPNDPEYPAGSPWWWERVGANNE